MKDHRRCLALAINAGYGLANEVRVRVELDHELPQHRRLLPLFGRHFRGRESKFSLAILSERAS